MEPQLNPLALVVAALVPMIMGFVYYHPKVLGDRWMKANGFTLESIGTGPKPVMYLLALAASFLLAIFIWANVTGAGGQDPLQVSDPKDGHSYVTFGHGVVHGIIMSVLVVLPIFVTMTIFEKRSWGWAFVNWGYWALTIILMAGILSAWR